MKQLILKLVAAFLCLSLLTGNALASTASDIESIIAYAQSQGLLQSAGNLQDWYAIALGQYNPNMDFSAYRNAAESLVQRWYVEDISRVKLTDRQRLSMALLAAGGDPTHVGGHALLADCTYRASIEEMRRQGIISCIFALLALDMGQYPIPSGNLSREQLVEELLSLQLADGGFALMGTAADPDITGLALQALAPYVDNPRVREAVDRAIACLSALQRPSGGFASLGVESAESTAQVLTALCMLGISLEDSRFVKNGHTVLDGLLQFQNEDGGFSHSRDSSNSNAMATAQALGALVALWRQQQGLPPYYRVDTSATQTPGTTTSGTLTTDVKSTVFTDNSGSSTLENMVVVAAAVAGAAVVATGILITTIRRRRQ